MKKIATHKSLLASLLVGACTLSAAQADTVTLIDHNFDAGLSVEALTLGGGSVNLRSGTDAINTYNAGNPYQRFSIAPGTTFFNNASTNKFLVLGDDSGQLAGSPTSGTFGFAIPFSLVSGTTDITVSFDWVFSSFGTGGDADQFSVGIIGNDFNVSSPLVTNNSVLGKSITNTGKEYELASTFSISVASLGAADANGQYWLSFGLFENASSNNSAVGIDNIKLAANVAPVPVPGAAWLLGSGVVGLLGLQRRKAVA